MPNGFDIFDREEFRDTDALFAGEELPYEPTGPGFGERLVSVAKNHHKKVAAGMLTVALIGGGIVANEVVGSDEQAAEVRRPAQQNGLELTDQTPTEPDFRSMTTTSTLSPAEQIVSDVTQPAAVPEDSAGLPDTATPVPSKTTGSAAPSKSKPTVQSPATRPAESNQSNPTVQSPGTPPAESNESKPSDNNNSGGTAQPQPGAETEQQRQNRLAAEAAAAQKEAAERKERERIAALKAECDTLQKLSQEKRGDDGAVFREDELDSKYKEWKWYYEERYKFAFEKFTYTQCNELGYGTYIEYKRRERE